MSTGIKIHFKVPSEGGSQAGECQQCLVQLLRQRSSRARAMDTALVAGLQGNEMYMCVLLFL